MTIPIQQLLELVRARHSPSRSAGSITDQAAWSRLSALVPFLVASGDIPSNPDGCPAPNLRRGRESRTRERGSSVQERHQMRQPRRDAPRSRRSSLGLLAGCGSPTAGPGSATPSSTQTSTPATSIPSRPPPTSSSAASSSAAAPIPSSSTQSSSTKPSSAISQSVEMIVIKNFGYRVSGPSFSGIKDQDQKLR